MKINIPTLARVMGRLILYLEIPLIANVLRVLLARGAIRRYIPGITPVCCDRSRGRIGKIFTGLGEKWKEEGGGRF